MLQFDSIFIKKIHQREKKEHIVMTEDSKELATLLYNLCALTRIERDLTSWLEHEYFTYDHIEMIRNEIKIILGKMKRYTAVIADTL